MLSHNFSRERFSFWIGVGIVEELDVDDYFVAKDMEFVVEMFDAYCIPGNYLCCAGGDVIYKRIEGANVQFELGIRSPVELSDEELMTDMLIFLGDCGGPRIIDGKEAHELMTV